MMHKATRSGSTAEQDAALHANKGSWVWMLHEVNAEGDSEPGKMAKEAEVLAAINRKAKDARVDCYVMTTPQDTSEKHLLKGIQASSSLHSQIIKGVSAGSARKSLSGTLSTAGDGAASPTGTLPAAGTLAPATPSAHKDKRPRAAPPSASPQPLPDAEPNHASPNTEARMDAEHAEHADGVPANLDSVMADADDNLDGDLSDLIDDAEEQAEAHAKAEKEKERQKGGPFLSTSPEEQGQGPDSSYVPTQEQTGAQHGQDASLDDSFDAPSQAVLAGLRILRNDEQREERHRQAVANFHGSDDPGSPGKSPPQAPRRTKGKTGYELKAVRAAETYLASGGSPGVLDQHEKGSAAKAAKTKAAAFYEEDEDDDRDEEEESRPSHIPETGTDPEYDAMRTQAEGTTRGQFASPGKPAAAAADDTRDRPERRNPARSARNGNKTTGAAGGSP